ncbi:ACT domain-containing protein [Alteromonas oceanisediminis]|uniref:ACT domain-containing protein n=1 Tax=Alteromonas oceanisediminis TaxID=2836180 RepID=UPI001BD9DDDB|nr:ACT domain-containing protein [Alteromonas oceanisediminis]MBT0587476.1 ACT domain-containing protein [Alteromonas oceanisediminis]
MVGETNLTRLLQSMSPELDESEWVFCVVPSVSQLSSMQPAPKCIFREKEGVTVILTPAQAAQHELAYHGVFRCITLSVHSSLQAVGLTAAVATALANENISANVVAAYHHDHIFVQCSDAERALSTLQQLSAEQ